MSFPPPLPLPFRDAEAMHRALLAMPKFAEAGSTAARFGLETMRSFCEKAGSPHLAYPVVHVAGTNGKGSTCRLLDSILRQAGLRTGLTTSPHLLRFNERIRIDGREIRDSEMMAFFERHDALLREFPLTYFELATAMAFWFFAERGVEVAVVEVGLGGRLDATNIVRPAATAIVSIGLDHTDLLGPTLAHIAREKAGIAKPGVPLVVGDLLDEAMREVRSVCSSIGSPLIVATGRGFRREMGRFQFRHRGQSHSASAAGHPEANRINGAIATELARLLDAPNGPFHGRISGPAMVGGIESYRRNHPLQAHFTPITGQKGWYVDGAHNAEAFAMLIRQLERLAPLSEWVLVLGMMSDKLDPALPEIFARFGRRYFMEIDSPRAVDVEAFDAFLSQADPGAAARFERCPGFEDFEKRHEGELAIFTGSFYIFNAHLDWKRDISPLR